MRSIAIQMLFLITQFPLKPEVTNGSKLFWVVFLLLFFYLVIWFAFVPPVAIHDYPSRDDNQLVCHGSRQFGYFVSLIYPIALIIVCTWYAVRTRKIPEAFNESKHIGFTMYSTCIIWLAFVPIYFITSQDVVLNLTTMAFAISLSATVTLLCFFTPKVYIVLLQPEKNVRQSMNPQLKSGQIKTSATAMPASQSGIGAMGTSSGVAVGSTIGIGTTHSAGTATSGGTGSGSIGGGTRLEVPVATGSKKPDVVKIQDTGSEGKKFLKLEVNSLSLSLSRI